MALKNDEFAHVITGWHVQSKAPSPYTQTGNTMAHLGQNATIVGTGQPGSILPNAGYADTMAPAGVKVTTPAIPATTVLASNTTSFVVTVVITGGNITAVKVGTAGQTFAQATQEGTGAGTYIVPPNGSIGIAYTAAPTWTWTD